MAILDDPLSALDAGTGKNVFEKLFKPTRGGLFSNTAVVLVTHASHFLKRVDSLLVLVNGKSVFFGEWGDLALCQPTDASELDAIEAIRSSVQEAHSNENDTSTFEPASQPVSSDTTVYEGDSAQDKENGRIMTQEERKYGLSQLSTWASWFSYAGGWVFSVMVVVTMTLDRYWYVAIELWIGEFRYRSYDLLLLFPTVPLQQISTYLPQLYGRKVHMIQSTNLEDGIHRKQRARVLNSNILLRSQLSLYSP